MLVKMAVLAALDGGGDVHRKRRKKEKQERGEEGKKKETEK